jgi:hypothetical protein
MMKAALKGLVHIYHGRFVAASARALTAVCLLPLAVCLSPSRVSAQLPSRASAQTPAPGGGEIVDRMVAVVNGGGLITYSDLLWQLALQPGVPLDNPRQEDLRRVLDVVIDQRLVLLEASKLPHAHATEKEISDAETDLIKRFPSLEEFQRRLDKVGLTSEQLAEIIHDRIDMEKYLDFRFRSFTVVTPQEVESYYKDVYVPGRRRATPGAIVPELKDVYDNLQKKLMESKIETDTDTFLDDARTNAQITILDESLKGGS